jgi:hypothetical protein
MGTRILSGDTETLVAVMTLAGSLQTGLSDVLLKIRRTSDDYLYDFNDDTFKASGWTSVTQVMSEVSAANVPGQYEWDFDTSAITNETADDTYIFSVTCASADNVPQQGELKVDQWVQDLFDEHDATQVDVAGVQSDTDNIQTRIPAALVAGLMASDAVAVSGDTGAADNLEATYDGTGYEDPYAPAQQQQLDQIAITGAAINTVADSAVLSVGSTVSGDVTETEQLDSVYWQIADAAGETDVYFEFLIPADGVPTTVTHIGRLTSGNDDLNVFAWNWVGALWEQVGVLEGQNIAGDSSRTYILFTAHVGTAADLGKVRVRFQATGLTSSNFYTDQLFLSYSVVTRSVGYAEGAIWIDTVDGSPGTTSYINGTADNPVDTLADATTISTNLGLRRFRVAPQSSITLAASYDGFVFSGSHWTLNLGGQSISDATIIGANVSGVATGVQPAHFSGCFFGTVTLPLCHGYVCSIEDVITLTSSGAYLFHQCFSGVAGVGSPAIDFGLAVANTQLNMRLYSGGVEIRNMEQAGSDTMSLEGNGQLIIASSCTGGTVAVRGNFTVTDNSGGVVTLSDDARLTRSEVADGVWDEAIAAHVAGGSFGSEVQTHATQAEILSDATPFAGANIDAAVSSRSSHSAADAADSVWDEAVVGHVAGGSFGAEVQAKAEPGDQMDLVADAVDATSVATDAIDADALAADAVVEIQSGLATAAALAAVQADTDDIQTRLPAALVGGRMDVDVGAMQAGVVTAAVIATDAIDADALAADAVAEIVEGVWDEVLTGATHNIPSSAGRRLRQLAGRVIIDGTAVGPGTGVNQIVLDVDASSVDGAYDPGMVVLVEGTGAGQSRMIFEYVGSTKTATVDRNWKVVPDATSKYVIFGFPGREHVNEGTVRGGTVNTVRLNALASSSHGAYIRQSVFVRSGTGDDQVRTVIAYDGTTKWATVDEDWDTVPDTTSGYAILPTREHTVETLTEPGWDTVFIDTVSGVAGTAFPLGTRGHPVSNITDAATIASGRGICRFSVVGSVVLDAPYVGCVFLNHSQISEIDFNGRDVTGSSFENLTLTGVQVGAIIAENCILDTITDMEGVYNCCSISSDIDCKTGVDTLLWRCRASAVDVFVIDMNGAAAVGLIDSVVNCEVRNMTDVNAVLVKHGAGRLVGGSSNTAGDLRIGGEARWIDSGVGAGVVVINDTTRSVVWDELLAAHSLVGSSGLTLSDVLARLPLSLVGGRMRSHVEAFDAGVIDSASIGTGAIDADSIDTDAITAAKIAADAITSSELSTSAVNEIRDSILSDSTPFDGANVDAVISSRAAPGDDMGLTATALAAVNTQLEVTSGHGAGAWTTSLPQDIRDAMKLSPTVGAPAAGSVDQHLDDIEAGTVSISTRVPTALVGGRMDSDVGNMQTDTVDADALADDAVAEIQAAVSEELQEVLGLLHKNSFIDSTVYDVDNQITSARIRTFDTRANALAATDGGSGETGEINTYMAVTEWESPGRMRSYRVVLEP